MNNQPTTGYAPINGLQMYYEIYGSGNMPLVLIHGGGSTIESTFGNILPHLLTYGKIIAVELQAHGRTTDRDAPESFEQDADDVAALLRFLNVDKANFFGYSNGATTTVQIAIRHPRIVNKIVPLSGSYQREGFINGFFDGFENTTVASFPAPLRDAFLKVMPDENRMKIMFDKDVARMVHFKDIPDNLLASIQAPALIMTTDKDVVPAEHAIKISRLIPNARLVILPGFHGESIGDVFIAKENNKLPAITAALIMDFLSQ